MKRRLNPDARTGAGTKGPLQAASPTRCRKESLAQRILLGYAIVATGVGLGLYRVQNEWAFLFLSSMPIALIAAMGIEYWRTR